MNNTAKAIQTVYNGYRFRSRLEARWAVFFDVLGVEYEYEKEGYDLGKAGWYLPDFWLPHFPDRDSNDGITGVFVEIKPAKAKPDEYAKALALAEQTGQSVFVMQGLPFTDKYTVTQIQVWDLGRLEKPIIIENLQFQEHIEKVQYEGFPVEYLHSIGLSNDKEQAHGFVGPPLCFGMKKAELDAAYLAARQASFERGR